MTRRMAMEQTFRADGRCGATNLKLVQRKQQWPDRTCARTTRCERGSKHSNLSSSGGSEPRRGFGSKEATLLWMASESRCRCFWSPVLQVGPLRSFADQMTVNKVSTDVIIINVIIVVVVITSIHLLLILLAVLTFAI